MFPNRNTYTFENGVRITSEFEAGNLWRCEEFAAEAANEVEPPVEDEEVEKDEAAEETKTQSPDGTEETKNDGDNDDALAAGNGSDQDNTAGGADK